MLTQLETETCIALKRAALKIANENIDWEERRYEIVKSVLPAMVTTYGHDCTDEAVVKKTIDLADEAIRALRKTID